MVEVKFVRWGLEAHISWKNPAIGIPKISPRFFHAFVFNNSSKLPEDDLFLENLQYYDPPPSRGEEQSGGVWWTFRQSSLDSRLWLECIRETSTSRSRLIPKTSVLAPTSSSPNISRNWSREGNGRSSRLKWTTFLR